MILDNDLLRESVNASMDFQCFDKNALIEQ